MTPDEHLDKIIAKCREVIELGEERTPGKWQVESRYVNGDAALLAAGINDYGDGPKDYVTGTIPAGCLNRDNSAFIAACAGPAEAAARSTIAAIELIREVANEDGWASVKHYVDIIRAAWPFEIL